MSPRGAAIEELATVYRDSLPRFVRAATAIVGDDGLAFEAVQDAFAHALRVRRSFRREVGVDAWMWRIVVNTALTARRRRRAEPAWDAAALDELPAENGWAAEDTAVRAWVAALPERQRLAVFLRYFADLDYRAIAAVLDIEVGTVSATLSSAHAALRRAMQEEVRR